MTDSEYMKIAIDLAKDAALANEVPVGAVIVKDNKIISKAHNRVETDTNPVAHAEILAIQNACSIMKDKFLEGCDLYVTLEPCAMCAQAIAHARIRRVYFGAYDPKSGGVEHGAKVYSHKTCHFKPDVYGGVCEDECVQLIKNFFHKLRTN